MWIVNIFCVICEPLVQLWAFDTYCTLARISGWNCTSKDTSTDCTLELGQLYRLLLLQLQGLDLWCRVVDREDGSHLKFPQLNKSSHSRSESASFLLQSVATSIHPGLTAAGIWHFWHLEVPTIQQILTRSDSFLLEHLSRLNCGWNVSSSFWHFWHFKFPQLDRSTCAQAGNIPSVISITIIPHLKAVGTHPTSYTFCKHILLSHTLANPKIVVEFLILTLNALPTTLGGASS